jgi:hypothetical protein
MALKTTNDVVPLATNVTATAPATQSVNNWLNFGGTPAGMKVAPGGYGAAGFYTDDKGILYRPGGLMSPNVVVNPTTGFSQQWGGNWLNTGVSLLGSVLNWMQGNKAYKLQKEAFEFEKDKFKKNFEMAMDAYRRKANQAAGDSAWLLSNQSMKDYANVNDYYNTGAKFLKSADAFNGVGNGGMGYDPYKKGTDSGEIMGDLVMRNDEPYQTPDPYAYRPMDNLMAPARPDAPYTPMGATPIDMSNMQNNGGSEGTVVKRRKKRKKPKSEESGTTSGENTTDSSNEE